MPERSLQPVMLEALLAGSHEAIIAHDAAENVVSWNPAAERMFGMAAGQVLGRSVFSALPDSRGYVDTSRNERAPVSAELRVRRSNGGQLAVTATFMPLVAPGGELLGGLVLLRPTPEQNAVDADGERLSLALAASGLGDWSWDARTDIVTLSARAATILGVPDTSRMTWAALRELLHADDREPARLAVEKAIEERSDYAIEYRVLVGESERWVYARGRPRLNPSGQAIGLLGVVQDISRERLLLHVDDAVRPLVDPADITYTAARVLGQYLRVDRCAYAFVEEDQDTFILTGNYTNGVHSIVGTYRFRQFGAECLRLMRAGDPYVVEDSAHDSRIDAEDRKAYELTAIRSVICVPIRKSDRFVAAMAVHMNSPRTWSSAEVELVQQVASRCWESIERARVVREREGLLEAAEAANRSKDEFLAMLGHELRNPLAPIVTALELMRHKSDATLVRERMLIERQVSHLTRLVDDLLDVSRIARGKVELKREFVEMAEIVTRAVEVASPLLEQRGHVLELDLQRTGMLVYGDAARLVQIVTNLLTNAAKYTPEAGRICVSATTEDDEVVLRVKDNGIGMTPEVLAQAFDMFVQGRQSIDRARGGLGLGLTIVRSLVERHGGKVTAHSAGAQRGSEFVVRLPGARQDSLVSVQPEPPPAALRNGTGRGRILIVDDNEDAAEMLAAWFASRGCAVEVAHDGVAALRAVEQSNFDLALLDIGLPVMDGYELAARLKERSNFGKTRLIAVTGYGQESDRRRAFAAGFEEHLVKPVDVHALERILGSLLETSAGET